MKPILHLSSILLLAAIALALAACGGVDGSGPAVATSPLACQPAPEKRA